MNSSSQTIPSWPDLYQPPMRFDLPTLKLNGSMGLVEVGASRGSSHPFSMYICGITPYDATHLGHAATYIAFDLINRYQRAMGTKVEFVENITDIDEPLLERAERDNVDWQELAASQIDLFRSDMSALHIHPPKAYVPATAVMTEIDRAISQMKVNGFVYTVDQDLYMDISSFLADLPIPLDEALTIFAERGGDPQRIGKRHPLDPVLWWANKNNEPGWESSHGFGRPGWHIECSVIALRYLLGEDYLSSNHSDFSIELQGGGSDLIFPHHFMSGAQGKAILGQPFARHYVHAGMVGLDGEKMSKSKGNLVFVSRLLNEGVDPVSIRYALLRDHYQSDRMWSAEKLKTAQESVANIRIALSREEVASTDSVISKIVSALANNLDTPAALNALEEWALRTIGNQSQADQPATREAGNLSRILDSLLGLAF
jgi:L-cysteine:1D-myo-inositol 2-amino-2-deoxy-alpha-D-glucopyranoside ligase